MDKDIILNGVISIVIGLLVIAGVLIAGYKITIGHIGILMLACIVVITAVSMIMMPSVSLVVAFHNRRVLKDDIKMFEVEILTAYEASNKALKINEIRDEVIVGAIEALQSFGVEDIEDAMKYYYNSIERLGNKEFNTILKIDSTMVYKGSMDKFAYNVDE